MVVLVFMCVNVALKIIFHGLNCFVLISCQVDGLAALTSAGTMELQTKITGLEKENKNLKKGELKIFL